MSQQLASELTMSVIHERENLLDPYPLYRRIREVSPVFWDAKMGQNGAWMITGYDAAVAVLLDHKLYSARRPEWDPSAHDAEVATACTGLGAQMFAVDPPAHARLRKQVTKPFSPRAVERLRPVITEVANELIDAVLDRGEMDLLADFAMPLGSSMVCRVLGVPLEDRELMWRHILNWGMVVDDHPLARENPNFHLAEIGKYLDYFAQQVAKRREARTDDLIQALTDGWDEGLFADEVELFGNLMFLLTAGQTTTAHQMGNTMRGLLEDRHADVLAQLTANPSLVPPATPEFMRYDGSVQLVKRRPVQSVELAGQQIGAGEELFVWLGAANRDPAVFVNPDQIILDRPKIQHLALSHGSHYCLGGQFGQLVNEIGIQLLLERVRNPKIVWDKLEPLRTGTFQGSHLMPLTFG
jgi:cytochrome P450